MPSSDEPFVFVPTVPDNLCDQISDSVEPLPQDALETASEADDREYSKSPMLLEVESEDVTGPANKHRKLTAGEVKAHWNFCKIITLLGTSQQCVQFAEERGLIPTTKNCSHHRRPMSLERSRGTFGNFRCNRRLCRMRCSRTIGTWFENAHLPVVTMYKMMYCYTRNMDYEETRLECSTNETVLSSKTIADWFSSCRETVVAYQIDNAETTTKIGGPGVVVQIEKAKLGERKFIKGCEIEDHWVIAMIQDNSKDLRIEVCPDHASSAAILMPLIQKHVEDGSVIKTDCWEAYNCLPEFGYTHKIISHSDKGKKNVTLDGPLTQEIESHWRVMKNRLRELNGHVSFANMLVEYTWRRHIKLYHLDPFEEFIKCIKYVFKLK